MKLKVIIYLSLIFFTPVSLFSAFPPVKTTSGILQTSRKLIAQVQLSLEESIADLGKIFGVKIEVCGKSENISGNFNLNLKHATLEDAVKEAIRKAGIQNHALVWDKPNQTLRLFIFEAGKNQSTIKSAASRDLFQDDTSPLTQEQLYLLAQQDIDLQNKDDQPLTLEQLEQLQKQSTKIEAEERESRKSLTPEQLQQLQKQSAAIEAEEKENSKPLTPEQLQQLQQQSEEIGSQENENMEPLSAEQVLLLQDIEEQDSSSFTK